jgi:hypothetical protein
VAKISNEHCSKRRIMLSGALPYQAEPKHPLFQLAQSLYEFSRVLEPSDNPVPHQCIDRHRQ